MVVVASKFGLSTVSKTRGFIQNIFIVATFLLLVLSVVIPNSLQNLTAAVMVICFFLSMSITKLNHQLALLGFLYLCSLIVTVFYLIVGHFNGAPDISVPQIIIIYILSPLLWICILTALVQTLGVEQLIRWFVVLTFISCVSVAIFFYLFINFGSNAVSFFKEDSNLNLSEGYSGAIMFVYGSLIFLCGGFFSTPEIIEKMYVRILLLASLVIVALTSGRSALILSIPLGLFFGGLLPYKARVSAKIPPKINIFVLFLCIVIAFFLLISLTDINPFYILDLFMDELLSGGGSARTETSVALLSASFNSFGLGSGHGVGIDIIRDYDHPWRYEAVMPATIFRVGLIGSMIYLMPFIWYSVEIVKLANIRELPIHHKFLFSGFVSAFLATNTNPYIESFVFQWMYVLPIVALLSGTISKK